MKKPKQPFELATRYPITTCFLGSNASFANTSVEMVVNSRKPFDFPLERYQKAVFRSYCMALDVWGDK